MLLRAYRKSEVWDHRSTGPAGVWIPAAVALAAIGAIFFEGLSRMVGEWSREEYSYAYLIPLVSVALVWRKRGDLANSELRGSWAGLSLVVAGLFFAGFGELSTIYILIQYGFLLVICGICLSLVGWKGIKIIWTSLAYLVFMIPIPVFLYQNLSAKMQLLSSMFGVFIIRLLNISVYLEGNIIDLGAYQLQVVEACSGLRYLFPLMSFGFLFACLYRGSRWRKILLFLFSVPITILINSIRIGITGILVEYLGISAAEGFLHLFEGWIIFLGGITLLFLLAWILTWFSGDAKAFGSLLEIRGSTSPWTSAVAEKGRKRGPYIVCVGMLVGMAVVSTVVPARSEIIPERESFASFPMRFDDWIGREQKMDHSFLDVLKLDDYLLANYARNEDTLPVHLYLAYYGSQRKGASAHSPRSCIPAGGWEIEEIGTRTINDIGTPKHLLSVNRALIAKGSTRQVVYYWFQQRGRELTNEYVVKWMIFWDSLTRQRTDGALVRMITPVDPLGGIEEADARLSDFLRLSYPAIVDYVPD
jgi:exosortase D (VPLPA-CTERM-specific)